MGTPDLALNHVPNQNGKMEQSREWPYVLKPRWIHDLLLLWRRKEPYELYLDHVSDYTVRELRDKAARRQCVLWLATHFAPSRASATLAQNVWASYSHHFPSADLAAAYLAHLILCEPLARQAATLLHGQIIPGAAMNRSHLSTINVAPAALDAFMRTLLQWEVLAADPRKGGYMVDKRLCVPVQSFPLLVWVWWLETRQASITPMDFAQLPLWAWFETEDFAAGWQRFAGQLWTLEMDRGEQTIFLHPTDTAAFTRSLLNLLSADGRRGRQLPRHDEHRDARPEARPGAAHMRERILGR
jgi:hypothetical protein